jgi:hypothetical protein
LVEHIYPHLTEGRTIKVVIVVCKALIQKEKSEKPAGLMGADETTALDAIETFASCQKQGNPAPR